MHLSLNNSLGKWILPTTAPFSPEATNYFSRLDAAGDTTYVDYKQPLANYIDSLVSLGGAYWDTMESSTSFVGVGIQGVTVPLKDGMPVPTNNNFVAGDLDQLTGLKGDGSTKYLGTGLNATDLAQNDASISVYITTGDTASAYLAGAYSAIGTYSEQIVLRDVGSTSQVKMFSSSAAVFGGKPTSGILGVSRVDSANQHRRANQVDYNEARSSVAPVSSALTVFAISGIVHTDARLATYHAGPALNLATLEGLQDTLLSEIRTAHTFVAAASYFSRLAAAGDTTHVAYKQPLTNYITSLVELGGAYWDTMLSSASFVGVGIQGITVPLRSGMTVPTQNNFVAADLNQLTGLKGDGSTKDIRPNLLSNDIAQNDGSLSVYQTEAITNGQRYTAGSGYNAGVGGGIFLRDLGSTIQCSVHGGLVSNGTGWVSGLIGGSRSSSTTQTQRTNQTDYPFSSTSSAPTTDLIRVFAAGTSPRTNPRLATYHVGPALNLATLEGLQDTLITEIAAI